MSNDKHHHDDSEYSSGSYSQSDGLYGTRYGRAKYRTLHEAAAVSKEIGLKGGVHPRDAPDGSEDADDTLWMPGDSHDEFEAAVNDKPDQGGHGDKSHHGSKDSNTSSGSGLSSLVGFGGDGSFVDGGGGSFGSTDGESDQSGDSEAAAGGPLADMQDPLADVEDPFADTDDPFNGGDG